jgi:hypothetical protein
MPFRTLTFFGRIPRPCHETHLRVALDGLMHGGVEPLAHNAPIVGPGHGQSNTEPGLRAQKRRKYGNRPTK